MSHPYTGDPNNGLVPNGTLPDDGVDKVKAADMNPNLAALFDSIAALAQGKVNLTIGPGKVLTIEGQLFIVATAGLTIDSTAAVLSTGSVLQAEAGSTQTGLWTFNAASVVELDGLVKLLGRKQYRPWVDLDDNDHTVSVADGDTFNLAVAPAAIRTITVTQTGPNAPSDGERMRFRYYDPAAGAGTFWKIRREGGGAVLIATQTGPDAFVEIECKGGVWRGVPTASGITKGVHW